MFILKREEKQLRSKTGNFFPRDNLFSIQLIKEWPNVWQYQRGLFFLNSNTFDFDS